MLDLLDFLPVNNNQVKLKVVILKIYYLNQLTAKVQLTSRQIMDFLHQDYRMQIQLMVCHR